MAPFRGWRPLPAESSRYRVPEGSPGASYGDMHASSVLAAGSPQRRPEGWRPSSQSCPGRMPTAWHLGESEPVTAVRIGTIGGRVRRLAHILSLASPRTGWSTWPPGALEHEALVRFRAGAVSDRSRQAAPLTWACHGRWQVAGSATRRPACCLPGSGPGRRLARWVRKVTAAPGRHGHEHRSRCSPRARRQHGVPYGARRHFEGFFAVPCRPRRAHGLVCRVRFPIGAGPTCGRNIRSAAWTDQVNGAWVRRCGAGWRYGTFPQPGSPAWRDVR